MKNSNTDISLRQAAIITGIGLLLMAIIAPIANFSILPQLYEAGDSATTAESIIESQNSLRMAVFLFFMVAVLDILVAWGLYVFLTPINKGLSLLAGWFRLVYAVMLAVAIFSLINVLQLINGDFYMSGLGEQNLQAQVMFQMESFMSNWEFSLIIFSFHLLLIGYLILKAGYLWKVLGILILLAGAGYLIDGIGRLLSEGYDLNISLYTFVGEVVLIFWLLIRGWRVEEAS